SAFWKLREVSLSYDLPVDFLARSQFIEGARISLEGRNLFMLTPKTNICTDQEYSDGDGLNNGNAIGLANLGQTPPSRYLGLTVSLSFCKFMQTKKMINVLLMGLIVVSSSSCKKILYINENPNDALTATPALILPQAVTATATQKYIY